MSLARANLTTDANVVYTSAGDTAIIAAYICNYSNTAANINLYLLDSNTAPATATDYVIYDQVPIQAHDTLVLDVEKILLDNGGVIRANATANNAVNVTFVYSLV